MGITEIIADFASEIRFSDLPSEAVVRSKELILDSVGVALAGCCEPVSQQILSYIKEYGVASPCKIIGNKRASPPDAALANGVLIHALDFDDYANDWTGHPTAPVLPAALALGEANQTSGKEILTAYILGTEIESKLGLVVASHHYGSGWHITATIGTLGAAVAAAKILKLNKYKTKMALGIAASLTSGLRKNFGTMTKPFQVGNAAHNGVVAGLLASKGVTADENILDGSLGLVEIFGGEKTLLSKIEKNLGNPFSILSPGICIKLYPCCSESHRFIDLVIELQKKHHFSPEEISEIELGASDMVPKIMIHSHPQNPLEAKFSVEYCIATAILDGKVGLNQFTSEKISDQKYRSLGEKVKFFHPRELRGMEGLHLPATVKIKLGDGREYFQETLYAKGEPQSTLSKEEILAKFTECANLTLPPERVEECPKTILNLEEVGDIAEFNVSLDY